MNTSLNIWNFVKFKLMNDYVKPMKLTINTI